MKKMMFIFYIFFILFNIIAENDISSDSNKLKIKLFIIDFKELNYEDFIGITYNFKDYLYRDKTPNIGCDFIRLIYIDKMQKYQLQKPENPIRRAEILFFGSLTFTVFGGWLFFSIYNAMIYNDPFGRLRNEQFLSLYFGSCVIAFSVSLSDLFINLKPKFKKNIEIY
jgi:hypothetical protein